MSKTQWNGKSCLITLLVAPLYFVALACFSLVLSFFLPLISSILVTTNVPVQTGRFTVPGNAYIDGRDISASPPLTMQNVNVWDSPSRNRTVCSIAHGGYVDLLSTAERGGRTYFQVEKGSCRGWVSEPFLSDKSESVVGDLIP